ncbi:MAG: tryptophan synthase subunit alpha [Candidatus Omnitrophica bacterium]|nr:tryptophan synthase subunit alpha [Candidatus Omnitrophota bacterium]
MNRIDLKFKELRAVGKKAFIAFITAGDPDLETTEALVLAFEKAGADIVELGVPFSDPQADGPTIQAASFRSIQKGTTLVKILKTVKKIRERSSIPIALMTYYNPVFHFGDRKFVEQAKAAGVDGVIIPDLPVEEASELCRYALAADLSTIFFLAPTTSDDRMKVAVNAATGFIYYVSVAGVTGSKAVVPSEIAIKIRTARRLSDKPICVGFGVSTPEQVHALAAIADGVIVGSAIVKEIEKHAGAKDLVDQVSAFVKKLSQAI